jgi:ribose transport system substrate-binding protein
LLAASCSWAAAQEFKVCYSAAGLIDDLQITWSENIRQAVETAGGEVRIVDSQNRNAKQLADIEDLLVQDIDVLAINPVDEAGIVSAVEAANQVGVPVITIDRASAGGDVAVHVEFDNYKAGYEAGQFIAEQAGGTGEVAQLEGQAGTSVARVRGDGFRDAIKEYPNMTIVMERPTDWSTSAGLAATEDLLQSHPGVVGIWTHADAIAMGAVEGPRCCRPRRRHRCRHGDVCGRPRKHSRWRPDGVVGALPGEARGSCGRRGGGAGAGRPDGEGHPHGDDVRHKGQHRRLPQIRGWGRVRPLTLGGGRTH